MERIDLAPEVIAELRRCPLDRILDAWDALIDVGGPPVMAALNRQDRFYLLTMTCGRIDAFRPWLYARCREVEAEPDDYLDLWAREHYKSTIITFAGCIQEALVDPEITVGIFSHNAPHAKKFLGQIKVELETNKALQTLHPEVLWADPKADAPKWSLDAGLCLKRESNPKEQTFEAHGLVDGMPTGSHFKLRVYDDVVTKESVGTPEQVKKTTESWSLSDALGAARMAPDGTMLPGRKWHIGTRYSFADSYQAMIEMKALTLRKYAATDNGRRDGKPIFFSPAQWKDKLLNMVPSVLAAQMLQDPAAGNEAMFQKAWLRYTDIRPKTLNIYILVDPANSKKKDSDRTSMAVIGVDAGRSRYLLDGYDHKMNLQERWQSLRELYRVWSNAPGVQMVRVGYERYGMQADLEYFEERMEVEKIHFTVDEVSWTHDDTKSKADRIERLVPDFMQGKFFLIAAQDRGPDGQVVESKNQRRCREAGELYRILRLVMRRDHEGNVYSLNKNFLEQFMVFPFAPKKDLLDACSRLYDMDPQPPVLINERDLEPEVFADGI